MTNPSDGVDYWLSIGGPASNPTGYMWAYCPENPALLQENGKKGASSGPVSQPVAQFGTYSVNASTLGISNQLWDNSLAQLTAASIATVVMTTVAKFIKNRIIGMATQDATEAAVAEGGAELVAEGVVEVGIVSLLPWCLYVCLVPSQHHRSLQRDHSGQVSAPLSVAL